MRQPETGYVNLLDQAMSERMKANQKLESSPIRPSSASDCPQKIARKLTEYYKKADYGCAPLSPTVTMLLDHGTDIEQQLILQFKQNGFEVLFQQQRLIFPKIESKVDAEFSQEVTGSIDFILKHGDSTCVVDVKSVGGTKWTWDAKTKKYLGMKSVKALSENAFWIEDVDMFLDELNDPFLTVNIAQLNYYSNSEFIKALGINHAVIIQYAKVDSRMRELRFKPSEKLFEKSNQGFREAIDAAATGKPESAPRFSRESVMCRYCRYNHICPTTTPSTVTDSQEK